jgi:hypothetical protein
MREGERNPFDQIDCTKPASEYANARKDFQIDKIVMSGP